MHEIQFRSSFKKSCENHISKRKIKEAYPEMAPDSFHFKSVPPDDVKKEVSNLNPKKSSTTREKVFNRIIYKQINTCMQDIISNYVNGFRTSHGTQHSLVRMFQRWKKAIDKGEYISVMYMDLSKTFDTINHDFLLAYSFSTSVLNLL